MDETKTTNTHDLEKALKANYRWHAEELYSDFVSIVEAYTGKHDEESLRVVLTAALRTGLITSGEIEGILGLPASRGRVWVREVREEESHRRLARQLLDFVREQLLDETAPSAPNMKVALDMPIEELGLSLRTRSLLGESFRNVGDLISKTPGDLIRLTNFGKQALREVEDTLRKHGFELKKS